MTMNTREVLQPIDVSESEHAALIDRAHKKAHEVIRAARDPAAERRGVEGFWSGLKDLERALADVASAYIATCEMHKKASGWREKKFCEIDDRLRQLEDAQRQMADAETALRVARREVEAAQAKTLADSYAGTYAADQAFARGQLVTDGGSLWLAIAKAAPGERPGRHPSWRLVAKGK